MQALAAMWWRVYGCIVVVLGFYWQHVLCAYLLTARWVGLLRGCREFGAINNMYSFTAATKTTATTKNTNFNTA